LLGLDEWKIRELVFATGNDGGQRVVCGGVDALVDLEEFLADLELFFGESELERRNYSL
jgi:hypothetical protein